MDGFTVTLQCAPEDISVIVCTIRRSCLHSPLVSVICDAEVVLCGVLRVIGLQFST